MELFDDRARAYRKSGDIAASIARSHFKLTIDQTTHERWRQLMGLLREVDTWADSGETSQAEVLSELKRFTLFEETYPALTPEQLGDTQAVLLRRTEHILKLGNYAAIQTEPHRFMALRVAEAREAVNMFEDVATNEVREQARFSSEFMPTLRALGEAATLWDSILDGQRDAFWGRQAIIPTGEYYAALARAMASRLKLGAGAMLHAAPLWHVAAKAGARAKNRFKNGVPDYSTLRLLQRDKT